MHIRGFMSVCVSTLVNQIAKRAADQLGGTGKDFWMVRARLAQVRGDVVEAEHILIDQGKVDTAIDMYQSLQRWDDAIAVAETQGHPQAGQMKEQYMAVSVGVARTGLLQGS